jgi:hypothetical protein
MKRASKRTFTTAVSKAKRTIPVFNVHPLAAAAEKVTATARIKPENSTADNPLVTETTTSGASNAADKLSAATRIKPKDSLEIMREKDVAKNPWKESSTPVPNSRPAKKSDTLPRNFSTSKTEDSGSGIWANPFLAGDKGSKKGSLRASIRNSSFFNSVLGDKNGESQTTKNDASSWAAKRSLPVWNTPSKELQPAKKQEEKAKMPRQEEIVVRNYSSPINETPVKSESAPIKYTNEPQNRSSIFKAFEKTRAIAAKTVKSLPKASSSGSVSNRAQFFERVQAEEYLLPQVKSGKNDAIVTAPLMSKVIAKEVSPSSPIKFKAKSAKLHEHAAIPPKNSFDKITKVMPSLAPAVKDEAKVFSHHQTIIPIDKVTVIKSTKSGLSSTPVGKVEANSSEKDKHADDPLLLAKISTDKFKTSASSSSTDKVKSSALSTSTVKVVQADHSPLATNRDTHVARVESPESVIVVEPIAERRRHDSKTPKGEDIASPKPANVSIEPIIEEESSMVMEKSEILEAPSFDLPPIADSSSVSIDIGLNEPIQILSSIEVLSHHASYYSDTSSRDRLVF